MENRPATEAPSLISLGIAKQYTENFLSEYFSSRRTEAHGVAPAYIRLWSTIETLFLSGGKRLRPYITMLSYQAYSRSSDVSTIVPAASAQELLHLAMLIHDDIIDRDYIRYGVRNVSGQYDEIYSSSLGDSPNRRHFADSAALLAGDLLLSDSYLLTAQCDIEPLLLLKAQRILNGSVFSVVGGELLDTESAFTAHGQQLPLEVARLKTASYSFIGPLTMGAVLAGASESEIAALSRLGELTGIAYQLQDDILGVFGDEAKTGKSSSSDITEGKYTHLIELFYGIASDQMKQRYESLAGSSAITEAELKEVRDLLTSSGAKSMLIDRIDKFAQEARQITDSLSISPEHKVAFHELITLATRRDK